MKTIEEFTDYLEKRYPGEIESMQVDQRPQEFMDVKQFNFRTNIQADDQVGKIIILQAMYQKDNKQVKGFIVQGVLLRDLPNYIKVHHQYLGLPIIVCTIIIDRGIQRVALFVGDYNQYFV